MMRMTMKTVNIPGLFRSQSSLIQRPKIPRWSTSIQEKLKYEPNSKVENIKSGYHNHANSYILILKSNQKNLREQFEHFRKKLSGNRREF